MVADPGVERRDGGARRDGPPQHRVGLDHRDAEARAGEGERGGVWLAVRVTRRSRGGEREVGAGPVVPHEAGPVARLPAPREAALLGERAERDRVPPTPCSFPR